jgi:hypothetical protein
MILSNWRICSLGVIQALFEGSMYAFVLMWTPALSGEGDDIPHGLIFSSLMLAMLAGSLLNDFFKLGLEIVFYEGSELLFGKFCTKQNSAAYAQLFKNNSFKIRLLGFHR